MRSIETNGTFEDAISRASGEVRDIARRLRSLIASVDPNVVEVPWPRQGTIGYGVGPKKMSEHYAWIGTAAAYAQIGFFHGAELPDPEGLLEGTGKLLRHVKVRSPGEVDRPALRDLIGAARDLQRRLTAGPVGRAGRET